MRSQGIEYRSQSQKTVKSPTFFQDALLSLVGATLLILVGVITLDSYDHPELGSPAGKALGGLCITAGGLFAINLLLVFKAIREEGRMPLGESRGRSCGEP